MEVLPMQTPRELRPLDYAGILDRTVELYRAQPALFIGIVAVVYIPLAILSVLSVHFHPGWLMVGGQHDLGFRFLNAIAPYGVAAATLHAVAMLLLGRSTTVMQSYMALVRVATPLVLTALICAVLVALGSLFFFLPGLVIAFLSMFAVEAVVLEGQAYLNAIQRSVSRLLAAREWVRALVLAVLVGAIIGVINSFVASILISVLGHGELGHQLVAVALEAWHCVIVPAGLIASVVLYLDIRVRAEGYSLEALASEIGGRPVAPPPPQPWNDAVQHTVDQMGTAESSESPIQ
jgi:hypothetical protein